MRVSFITNKPLVETGGTLYSPIASVRREILLPAKALADRGLTTHVISLPVWPLEQTMALLEKSDRIVFGTLIDTPGQGNDQFAASAAAYREVLALIQPRNRIVFCLSDHHPESPSFIEFYRDTAAMSRAWIASSEALRESLTVNAPSLFHVYPAPAELAPAKPRVPQRGIRARAAIWMARRSRVGLDPWRLRLLWFGDPSDVAALLEELPELETLAKETPLSLECVTQLGTELDAMTTAPGIASAAPVRLTSAAWSLEYMHAALENCDAVILPQLADDPQKRTMSNSQLVDTLQAGRFAIAHPIPSYAGLREYAWVGDSIAEGLRWMLRHPEKALRRVVAGQQCVARHHSLNAVAEFWLHALEIGEMPQPGTRLRAGLRSTGPILIGIMFSGENEYPQCVASLKQQTYRSWDHFVLENLPNKEAHDSLYERFMRAADTHALFLKLDADMVFKSASALQTIVDIFREIAELDHLTMFVQDWQSGLMIPGQITYSNRAKWPPNPDRLIVDHHPHVPGKVLRMYRQPAPLIDHSPNPAPLQAFQFGIHRAMKACLPDRPEKDISRALVHWHIISNIWGRYRSAGDIRRLYALMGVEFVFSNAVTSFESDYTHPSLVSYFEAKVLPMSKENLEGKLAEEWDYPLVNDRRFVSRLGSFDEEK